MIKNRPWAWVPTMYIAEGLPYFAVMTLSVMMYTCLGVSNRDLALYTGWLYLPWVIKPIWSPIVDVISTKRRWVLAMQVLLALSLASIAFVLPGSGFFRLTLAAFWIVAFASATHDIAVDGYYMIALDSHRQTFFVGIRTFFYRMSMLISQGGLVMLAGWIETSTGDVVYSWQVAFGAMSAFFVVASVYHALVLPRCEKSRPDTSASREIRRVAGQSVDVFVTFFTKPHVVPAIAFMLLYRLPEAQLIKLIQPFLHADIADGGMGLSTSMVGVVYGTVGIIGLTVGGILGGIVGARYGLRRCMMPMAWSMSLTCLAFVYLSFMPQSDLWVVYLCVTTEQFGYGFGCTAYFLYLLYYCEGEYRTSHYAIATGIMALGMMLPGMAAGWIQEQLGYRGFFVWTIICCAATIAIARIQKIDRHFGIK